MAKTRWVDLSNSQKVGIVVLGTVQVGLLAAALWDLVHRSPDEVRGDRRIWAGLVFINTIGPLAYFAIGRKGGVRCPPCLSSWSERDDARPKTEPSTG